MIASDSANSIRHDDLVSYKYHASCYKEMVHLSIYLLAHIIFRMSA